MAYVLAPAALADLQDIVRYTRRQWGPKQASRYRDQLEKCFDNLASGKHGFKNLANVAEGLRMIRCEHHYIFGRLRDGKPAAIYAVFHERMDLMARIVERLG